MECISSIILLMMSMPTPTTTPILTILLFLSWQIKNLRPCVSCSVILYGILVCVLLYEDQENGLFSALRLGPTMMEMNLLLRAKYDPSIGLCRSTTDQSIIFSPIDEFGNFGRAFLRYLIEPNYGKIYNQ